MKQKQLTNLIVSMTSLEIAEMTGKRHTDVVYDINLMFTVLNLQGADFSASIKMQSGQKSTVYTLPKRETLILVSGYSIDLRTRIIDRLDYLEKENLNLRSELLIKEKARDDARLEYRPMTDAVKAIRGDSVKAYHYSNEANLVYLVVMGATCKKIKEHLEIDSLDNLRDELTPLQIQAVQDIQKHNTTLIEIGMSYDERKDKLNVLFNRKWADKLLEEHIKLEA